MQSLDDLKRFTQRVLERAKSRGADYADVRVVQRDSEHIELRTGKVERLARDTSYGFGVRVIVDGAWGFASSPNTTDAEADRVADEAAAIARASSSVSRKRVELAPVDVYEGSFPMDFKVDPFEVALDEKIGLLRDADSALRENARVKLTECSMDFWRIEQVFASSEGSFIQQNKLESGAGIQATAIEGSEVQKRSYPCSFGGDYAAAGYEFVESLDLVDHAEETARVAAELLDAPVCPSVETDLILDEAMLALQIHESCGHPIELDRVFGTESSYAGTSFLTPDKLNHFRYGSEQVNITADATIPAALGSFPFDDEGVPAQRVEIVNEGVFCGYLTSRETAAEMGWTSGGAMRADGWNRIPLIRMTNINLLPGDSSLEEIIHDTQDGVYAVDVKSWSIDDKRLNFQFGTEAAWEIKDGSLGRLLKNPIYHGMTPHFWGSCDMIAGKDEWHVWGVPNCGKGEPGQSAHVGHGVSAARFRGVKMEGAE